MSLAKWIYPVLGVSSALAIALNHNLTANGVQTRDGTVAFEAGLLLVDAHNTFKGVRVRQARYYFDLELPEDIGESLQKVVVQQRTGGDEVKFRPEQTEVYLGSHGDKGEQIKAIAAVDEATGAISVELEQPIPPGSRVTIGLKPKSNPDYAGVYLFGVTAFPQGEKARGMYLGAGRLHFYRGDNNYF